VLAGRVVGNRGWMQLSKAEELVDRHWAVTVVGADLCACGIHVVWGVWVRFKA